MNELLVAMDQGLLAPGALEGGSVAITGLPALELILFDDAGCLRRGRDARATYACALASAIARNLATKGKAIVDAWTRPGAFATLLRTAGTGNEAYVEPEEATGDYLKSLHTALQAIIAVKLEEPLGESLDEARPRRAENWRSERSLADIQANFETAQALYVSPGGFGDLLLAVTDEAELDRAIRAGFERCFAKLAAIGRPCTRRSATRASGPRSRRWSRRPRRCACWSPTSWRRHSTSGSASMPWTAIERDLAMSEDRDRQRQAQDGRGMEFGRRGFLLSLGGSALAGFGLKAAAARGNAGPLYVGCRVDDDGRFFTSGFRADGQTVFDLQLPGRGHAISFRPGTAQCVVYARRPGRFAVVLDAAEGSALHRIDAAPGRHFYGHGSYSADGGYLLTTENDYEAGQGVIGVRDATDGYRQVGELPSHGVGPHEAALMPDGRTLAIANGGVRTHPDYDRLELNLESMSPSLTYLDIASGRVEGEARLAQRLHQLSIRHVAVNGAGLVAVAMQYEGDRSDRVPLVGLHDGGDIQLLEAPAEINRRMRQYTGAVVFDSAGELLAVSCPRGNLFTFWEVGTRQLLHHVELADGCGVTPAEAPGAFIVSDARGEILRIEPRSGRQSPIPIADRLVTPWDNHLAIAVLPARPV